MLAQYGQVFTAVIVTPIYNALYGKNKQVPVVHITFRPEDEKDLRGYAKRRKEFFINVEIVLGLKDNYKEEHQVGDVKLLPQAKSLFFGQAFAAGEKLGFTPFAG